MAVILALFTWLIVIPLAHGVVRWAISTLMPRYGWEVGSPGFWNRLGLIVVIFAAALLIWILVVGIALTPNTVKVGLIPSFLTVGGPYRLTRNPIMSLNWGYGLAGRCFLEAQASSSDAYCYWQWGP
jgi:hypothetical protein